MTKRGETNETPESPSECNSMRRSRPLLIAANRAPVTFHEGPDGKLYSQRGSGGLVTALGGLGQHVDVTWIGCALTEKDAEWGTGDATIWDQDSAIRVRFLTPEPTVFDGYYNVISNPLLWFLQHSMWDLPRAPVIDSRTWEAWEEGYVAVNRMFGEAIVDEVGSRPERPLVMLQDYHLYLAARHIRSALRPRERPTVCQFIHIPWPGPEYWRILPPAMRRAILDGLCAVDLLGFQTKDDGLNFLRTCQTHLPRAYVKYGKGRVWYRNHATHVRDFPISVDVASLKALASSEEVVERRRTLSELAGDRRLIVRIDRIEPSKNICRGFQAFAELLSLHPEHHGRVQFLALLVPSRLDVDEYGDYLDELMGIAGQINARYGDSDWEPIRLLVGEDYPRAIAALQMYDVLLVNSIADGMNLVAKEGALVNETDGVLVLSEGTGAHQQLGVGATVISPCDVYATAEALHQGLIMPQAEREERAALLRGVVEREDIGRWLCQQLESVSELGL